MMSLTPIDFFIRASDSLIKFNINFGTLKDEQLDIYSIEVRGSELNKVWARVQETFEECINSLKAYEDASTEQLDSVQSKYDVSYELFMDCLSTINRKLAPFRSPRRSSSRSSIANSVVLASLRSKASSNNSRNVCSAK